MTGTVHVSTRELPSWWVEKPLPAGVAPWRDTDPPQQPPANVPLPVDAGYVLRYEERDGERAIVYVSTGYDLTAAPQSGIWFARTVGGAWRRPLYVGLQMRLPYTVTRGSRLPLLEGTLLRVEVQIRESDLTTTSVPPVLLGNTQADDAMYLEFDLATLTADQDGDGLTDVEEHRLGLDFANADTDGDGVPDGRDPLPLVGYQPPGGNDEGLAHAIVSQLFSYPPIPIAGVVPTLEQAMRVDPSHVAQVRTHFLVGDPAMFAGEATSFRLMLYAPADVDALGPAGAPFRAARIRNILSTLDGRTHYVEWGSSGGGGSFIVSCDTPSTPCTVTPLLSFYA